MVMSASFFLLQQISHSKCSTTRNRIQFLQHVVQHLFHCQAEQTPMAAVLHTSACLLHRRSIPVSVTISQFRMVAVADIKHRKFHPSYGWNLSTSRMVFHLPTGFLDTGYRKSIWFQLENSIESSDWRRENSIFLVSGTFQLRAAFDKIKGHKWPPAEISFSLD